ncbi:MAG: DUF1566 domain-containing protein [Deltaproteobacteria bacterium]|nr:DUF1566 domain-containing protein [Deltaproteobacteria bacterium]
MKKAYLFVFICISAFLASPCAFAETVEVLIKGIDDGVKSSRDRDYKEAVMNAKLQAIERAGVAISSLTVVENFALKYDLIESRAKAVLLPGFQVIDVGYQTDGTYQVVLSGKVQVGDATAAEGKLWGKLRSKPIEFNSYKGAFDLWAGVSVSNVENQYVNNENGTVSDMKTGLMWLTSYEIRENILEVKQYLENLNKKGFAGYSDWRIPTLDELASIVEARPGGKLSGGRESYLDPIFDVRPYCWYLWSADRSLQGNFMAYVGGKRGGISTPGDHYQADGICVACIKAVRSINQ